MQTSTWQSFDTFAPDQAAQTASRGGPILHLLDDPGLGGATRLLRALSTRLDGDRLQGHRFVRTRLRPAHHYAARAIIVHVQIGWQKLPFLWTLRHRNPESRIILVEHVHTGAFEDRRVTNPARFRRMLRLAYGMADEVVAVSRGQERWLLQTGLVPRDRLRLIPAVPDLTDFIGLPPPDPARRPMRLGALGRFDEQAGFITLIEAMRLVRPEDAQLVLCGHGALERELRHHADGMPHVAVAGRADAVQFMAAVDAMVMPSLWDAGAVTCWEARAAGRPMIVTAVDGLPEQVPPDRGFVVPPGDVRALATAISRLAGCDRAGMSDAARRSVAGRLDGAVGRWRTLLSPTRPR